jgi:NADPH-dependent 2,4-dienoyl-CoA reductase/sulfur reductase-like enzyme
MAERIVIIGGVAAGMSAAAKARRVNHQNEIVVYEKSGYVSFGACGFPYFIKGEIPRIEKLLARSPEQFVKDGIQVHTHHEVIAIHPTDHTVDVVDLHSGRTFTDHWGNLILATGGHILRPRIPGSSLRGIFSLRTVEDALAIKEWIEIRQPRQAVILGAGYIGLEMAEALRAHGIGVSIVEQQAQVLPGLDEDIAAFAHAALEKNSVDVLLNAGVTSFIGESLVRDITERVTCALAGSEISGASAPTGIRTAGLSVREAVLGNRALSADIVILGMGGRPNASLAREAGITLGQTGAVAVDSRQRTNIPGIWAAGAVAEAYHRLLDRPIYMPTAPVANKQGRVAGTNAAGGQAVFPGILGTSVVKVFDLTVAQTGLTEKQAAQAGCKVNSATITSSSQAAYMPGNAPVHVKLVYDAGSQRVLGAQMVGDASVAKRIDVISAAIQAGWSITELSELDMSYSPPYAPVWDPVLTAAIIAERQPGRTNDRGSG